MTGPNYPDGSESDFAKAHVDFFTSNVARLSAGREVSAELMAVSTRTIEVTMRAMESISHGQPVEPIIAEFNKTIIGFDALGGLVPDLLDSARTCLVGALFDASQPMRAVEVMASMSSVGNMYQTYAESIKRNELASKDGFVRPPSNEILGVLINELAGNNIETAKDFLRYMRKQVFENFAPSFENVLQYCDIMLARYVGEGYNPVEDWVNIEAAESPSVDWQALATIVVHDELWEGQSLYLREAYMHNTGRDIQTILSARSLSKLQAGKVVRDLTDKDLNLPAAQYTLAQTVLALHGRDGEAQARKITEGIKLPAVRAYLAEQLLRRGDEAFARQVIMSLDNPHLLVGMLISPDWPNPRVPQKILSDIVDIKTARVGEKVISPYEIEFRINCINALADIEEQLGRDVSELRARPDLLNRQLASGKLIVKLPKKS